MTLFRPELIHPMLVHFPIALLIVGVLFRFFAFLLSKKSLFSFLLPASWMILFLGVITAWVAVFTGEFAHHIVAHKLPNTTIFEKHHEHGHLTAYGFTCGLFIDWVRAFALKKWPARWVLKKGLAILIWFFYLFGLAELIGAGFYGSMLVYAQGAAVK